ncbi:alanyl-tRNA editing protein [Magnetospirillum fulvum]|uniref:Alanine--tRNA ligase n=1 Tax=Magnetospirillum fulvum MGU-K5 TaxID=1316936 RepID=S9TUL4_MAGFU|nr:alanyl-tRNA editing protein [Magnetospirillum fulvum]EPY02160.1 threonyl/alanyl tRNA synthetase SAD [Magnetospirillum fulvum MGU-K5]
MSIIPTIKRFEADSYLSEIETVVVDQSDGGVCLEQTVFYAESGGQPGDTGSLLFEDGLCLPVADTRYIPGRLRILHVLTPPPGVVLTGRRVVARIDWPRRYRLMQMHTCLHLLCSAIDAPVTGCAIFPEYGRLDFDLEDTIDRDDLTRRLNQLVARDEPIVIECAQDVGVPLVRTVDAAPPPASAEGLRVVRIGGIDRQPCGGTHVRSTAEVGPITVTNVQKKGRRHRRIKLVLDPPSPPA